CEPLHKFFAISLDLAGPALVRGQRSPGRRPPGQGAPGPVFRGQCPRSGAPGDVHGHRAQAQVSPSHRRPAGRLDQAGQLGLGRPVHDRLGQVLVGFRVTGRPPGLVTRRISARPASGSATFRSPNEIVTASKAPSRNGSRSASPATKLSRPGGRSPPEPPRSPGGCAPPPTPPAPDLPPPGM